MMMMALINSSGEAAETAHKKKTHERTWMMAGSDVNQRNSAQETLMMHAWRKETWKAQSTWEEFKVLKLL
jgi:hypothetical protein